ncbi:MAG: hypothetical protein E7363_06240 [Clostridiales bacterium]|nr:hypothetical protein [Clostridiales bacterium]
MSKARSFWRGFLCVFIGIIVGIVLTVGGIGLTGYLMLKKTKLKKINDWTGTEIVGETTVDGEEVDLANMSLLQLFKQADSIKNSAKKMTIGNVEELFPVLNLAEILPAEYVTADKTAVNLSIAEGAQYLIPLSTLRTKTLKQAAEYIVDTAKEQTTFALLGTLGFNFEDFPFVSGTDGVNPVYTYVNLGADGYSDWYASRTAQMYYLSGDTYLPATASMLNGGAGDGVTTLYYKAQGFTDMPVVDGVNAMIAELDQEKLTIARLDEMLALGLKDENGEYGHKILEVLADKRIAELENSFDEITETLVLSDLFVISPGDMMYELQFLRYTPQTAAEYNAKPENALRPVSVGDYVLDANGNKIETTLNAFSQNVEYAKVKDVIKSTDSDLLTTLGEYTLYSLSREGDSVVNSLTLNEVLQIPQDNAPLNAIKYLRFTAETATAFNSAHGLSGAQAKKAGDKIPVIPSGQSYNPAGVYEYTLCTLADLADNVNAVPLGELLGVTASSERILHALSDTTLSGINDKIATLKLSDVIEVETQPEHPNYSKILVSLQDSLITELGEDVGNLALQDVVDITEESSLLLKNLATTKVTELPERMDTLKVKEAITITEDSSKALRSLADTYVCEIGETLDSMPVADMVEYDPTATDLFDRLMVDLADKNATLTDMGDKINHVKISALFDVNVDEDPEPDGVWRFLLQGVPEEEQTMEHLEGMIESCAENISKATIRELDDEGILDLPAETPQNKSLFDMQLNTLLTSLSNNWTAVSTILGAIS